MSSNKPSIVNYNVDVNVNVNVNQSGAPTSSYKFREDHVPTHLETFFATICLRDAATQGGLKSTYKYNNFVFIHVHTNINS